MDLLKIVKLRQGSSKEGSCKDRQGMAPKAKGLNPITRGGGRFFACNPIRRGLGVAQIADFFCMDPNPTENILELLLELLLQFSAP